LRHNLNIVICLILLFLLLPAASYVAAKTGVKPMENNSVLHWYWEWRQPPYGRTIDPSVYPGSTFVTWGSEDEPTLYAVTKDPANYSAVPHGIYKSLDLGLNWTFVPFDLPQKIGSIVVHPDDPDILLVAASNNYTQSPEQNLATQGLYYSSDGGATWANLIPDKIIYDIEVDAVHTNRIYASTCCGGGIFRSEDYGETWSLISDAFLNDIESHPTIPDLLFAARFFSMGPEEGIYRSVDGGLTWTEIGDMEYGQSHILIDQNEPNRMYAYWGPHGAIWRTEDSGESWVDMSAGIPDIYSDPTAYTAVLDPYDDTVWLGMKHGGVLVSFDHGETWEQVNKGFIWWRTPDELPDCTSMAVSSTHQFATSCTSRLYVRGWFKIQFLPFLKRD